MSDLIEFLRARLDEDALWATEASRRNDGPAVESGVHWQWEDADDKVCQPAPDTEAYIADGLTTVSLRSREEWPSRVGNLPQFAISTAEEVPTAVGAHIIRHDPARVLREVEAKRAVLAQYESAREQVRHPVSAENRAAARVAQGELEDVLRLLAAVYADHPDYREEWRP